VDQPAVVQHRHNKRRLHRKGIRGAERPGDVWLQCPKDYNIGGATFAYNPATLTATWTLPQTIAADQLVLNLSGIFDTSSNQLDGEWTNCSSRFPSGDGAAGGPITFIFYVLPGDVDGSNEVTLEDFLQTRALLGQMPGMAEYNACYDVDGSGGINLGDALLSRSLLGTNLHDMGRMSGLAEAGSPTSPSYVPEISARAISTVELIPLCAVADPARFFYNAVLTKSPVTIEVIPAPITKISAGLSQFSSEENGIVPLSVAPDTHEILSPRITSASSKSQPKAELTTVDRALLWMVDQLDSPAAEDYAWISLPRKKRVTGIPGITDKIFAESDLWQ
jgi:hypothetical protein